MLPHRTTRRLLRHHLSIGLLSALAAGLVLWLLRHAEDVVWRWSMATGYVGLALLATTLVPGALASLRGRRYPVSTDLRRDIGIWAALVSITHFLVGWQVHMKYRWQYFLDLPAGSRIAWPRLDLFGIANWTGLAAVLVAALLLALSNDRALRLLGSTRWKRLQAWNTLLFALVLVHGALYMVLEERRWGWVVMTSAVGFATVMLRLAARRQRRKKHTGAGRRA